MLAEFGGFEIVVMAGAMLGAAERGMTLLIDGFIVTSALLAASRIAPTILDYCVFCHRSAEPGHMAQLHTLMADPLINLGLRLGEGTGAALAWPLVKAAVAFLNEMASFESGGRRQRAKLSKLTKGCPMSLRHELEYFFGAIRFFTRLPVPRWVGHSSEALERSSRYFPAVGLIVGGIAALTFALAMLFWPKTLAVLAAMAITLYVTGAFHEDGWSDMVDGFGGGWEKAQILTIMKDSRIGSFGAVALVMMLLTKFFFAGRDRCRAGCLLAHRRAHAFAALRHAGHGAARLRTRRGQGQAARHPHQRPLARLCRVHRATRADPGAVRAATSPDARWCRAGRSCDALAGAHVQEADRRLHR